MGTMVDIDGVEAYRAEPVGPLKGALILIQEIWGLVDHIKDVSDRFAAQGYLVVSPDLLSSVGVTPEIGTELLAAMNHPDDAVRNAAQPRLREAFSGTRSPEFAAGAVAKLVKVVDALEAEPGVDGRIAVLGFCFGGTYSFALAAADPRVKAVVPFYGSAPSPEDIAKIHAPVLAFYGQHDERLIDALPEVEAAMSDAGVDFQRVVYPDAGHAFFNDTNVHAYNAADAADAWTRANAFLAAHL